VSGSGLTYWLCRSEPGFLARKLFERLDGFREDVSYGGSSFVWQARTKVPVLHWLIRTSARKYRKYGWSTTTPNHTHSKASISRVVEILKAHLWFCCKKLALVWLSAVSF